MSDDHSTDGSRDYLGSIDHPKIRYVTPPHKMSMAEHWEWALGRSCGEWLVFVGQDDALQPYFFQLADELVGQADRRGLNAINSERANYNWPGCETSYGDLAAQAKLQLRTGIRESWVETVRCLLGLQSYFDLPAMYTTALFRRSLIDRARDLQGGRIFQTHPQDANLAALCVSLTSRFLHSSIPLGWVGSSPKSAGLAIARADTTDQKELRDEYMAKVAQSRLPVSPMIGKFDFDDLTLYFWGALLMTPKLRSPRLNGWLESSLFRRLVLSTVVQSGNHRRPGQSDTRTCEFERILKINGVNPKGLETFGRHFRAILRFITTRALVQIPRLARVLRAVGIGANLPDARIEMRRTGGELITIADASVATMGAYQELKKSGRTRSASKLPKIFRER